MQHRFHRLIAGLAGSLLAGLLLAPLFLATPAAAQDRCYGDWSEAAPIVADRGLRSASDAQATARGRLSGDVVRIVLCESPSGYIYRIVMRRQDGRIANLTVNATGSGE